MAFLFHYYYYYIGGPTEQTPFTDDGRTVFTFIWSQIWTNDKYSKKYMAAVQAKRDTTDSSMHLLRSTRTSGACGHMNNPD